MEGSYIIDRVHFHGTLAANGTARWLAPFGLTLVHVSIAGSNTNNAQVKIGNTGTNGDDDYMAYKDAGDASAAEYDRADFVNGEYPHIPNGTTVLYTVDYDGSSGTAVADLDLVATYLVG